jgi:hypothetical protein
MKLSLLGCGKQVCRLCKDGVNRASGYLPGAGGCMRDASQTSTSTGKPSKAVAVKKWL